MLNTQETVSVIKTLGELVEAQASFTCFDVTRLVRVVLNSTSLCHNSVRELVHALYAAAAAPFGGADYVRNHAVTFRTKSGMTDTAEVYTLDGVDASTYDPDALAPTGVTSSASPVGSATAFDSDDDEDNLDEDEEDEDWLDEDEDEDEEDEEDERSANEFSTDSDGRLTIVRRFLKSKGYKPGKRVYVAQRNNGQKGLVLLKAKPSTGTLLVTKVSSRGELRLPATPQVKSGLSGQWRKVTPTDRAIVVTQA